MRQQISIYDMGETSEDDALMFANVCSEVAKLAGYNFEYEIISGSIPNIDNDAAKLANFVWEHLNWWCEDWDDDEKLSSAETIKWYAGIDRYCDEED